MNHPIIVIGAGGHASVLVETLLTLNKTILGVVAPEASMLKNYPHIAYLGQEEQIETYSPDKIRLVNGVGGVSPEKNQNRQNIFHKFKSKGYLFETLVHPFSFVASTAVLHEGAQVMAGVIIQPNAIIGSNAIINTRASIDHDCTIGHSVHVAPGVILSGNVIAGDRVHIGTGANVVQGIHIEQDAMVCAGVTITKNVLASQKVHSE
jgi:UDP-perosamine 4-acetyltransferase